MARQTSGAGAQTSPLGGDFLARNEPNDSPAALPLLSVQPSDPLARAREYAQAAGRNAAAGLQLGGREGLALIALAGRFATQAKALAREAMA